MKNIFHFLIWSVSFCLAISTHGQTAAEDNKPSQSITQYVIPTGPSVYGIFEGRPPCEEIARQVDSPVSVECPKVKWRISFFQDAVTKEPTTFQVQGKFLPATGKWKMIRGTKSDPRAVVLQLELAKPRAYFYFLKGDDNVLFVLDAQKELRVGNDYFSYTLNRVELVAKKSKDH